MAFNVNEFLSDNSASTGGEFDVNEFLAEGAREPNRQARLLNPSASQAADKGFDIGVAQKAAVDDWVANQHGANIDDVSGAKHDAYARAAGLSGNADTDFETIKQRQLEIDERKNKVIRDSGFTVTASGTIVANVQPGDQSPATPATKFNAAKSKEAYDYLLEAAKSEEIQQIAKDAKSVKGFMEVLKENRHDLIPVPIAGAMDDIQEAFNAMDMIRGVEDGTASDVDMIEMYRYITEQQRERSIGGGVAEIVTGLPQFMADIGIGFGMYGAGRALVTSGAKKILSKKFMDKVEGSLIKRGIFKAAQVTVGVTASAPVSGAGMAATEFYTGKLPELGIGETKEGLSLLVGEAREDNLYRSVGTAYIELLSERTGGAIGHLAAPIKAKLVKTSLVKLIASKNPGISFDKLKGFVDSVGYNGILGEMFEERVGEVARFGAGIDEEYHLPTGKQLVTELLAFSIPTGGVASMQGLGIAADRIQNGKYGNIGKAMERQMPFNSDGSYNPNYRPMPIFDKDGNVDDEIQNLMMGYQDLKAERDELEKEAKPASGDTDGKEAEEQAKKKADMDEKLEGMERAFSDLIDSRSEKYGLTDTLGQDAAGIRAFNLKLAVGLDPMEGATATDWKFIDQNYSDSETADHVLQSTSNPDMVPIALAAKHGDTEAQETYADQFFFADDALGDAEGILDPEEREKVLAEFTREEREKLQADIELRVHEKNEKIRREANDAVLSIVDELARGDVEIDADDSRVVTFLSAMEEQAKAKGWDQDTKEARITEELIKAAENQGISLEEIRAKVKNLKITGETSTEFIEDVLTYKIKLNQGQTPDTIYEEMGHVEFRRLKAAVGTKEAVAQVLKWKKGIEAETGEVTHGDTEGQLDEWLARKGVAWAIKNHQDQQKMNTIPEAIAAWMKRFVAKLKSVFADADLLRRLDAEGKLDPELKAFMQRAIGETEGKLESLQGRERFNPKTAGDRAINIRVSEGEFNADVAVQDEVDINTEFDHIDEAPPARRAAILGAAKIRFGSYQDALLQQQLRDTGVGTMTDERADLYDAERAKISAMQKAALAENGKPASQEQAMLDEEVSFQTQENERDAAFYSQLERTLSSKLQGKAASIQQVKGLLSPKHGVKAEEVKWSGIEQWLDDNADAKGKVKTADLMEYVRNAGQVKFEEVTRGQAVSGFILSDINGNQIHDEVFKTEAEATTAALAFTGQKAYVRDLNKSAENETQYSSYVLPNGENYREVVLTMPVGFSVSAKDLTGESAINFGYPDKWIVYDKNGKQIRPPNARFWSGDTKEEAIRKASYEMEAREAESGKFYTSPHFWNIPNYVAHMRLNEREDSEGNDGLFIEEIQSDRHQKARDKGYSGEDKTGLKIVEREDGMFGIQGEDGKNVNIRIPSVGGWEQTVTWAKDRLIVEADLARRQKKDLERGIADAPFRKDWNIQMFKRALRDAVASGKDWIGWTTGQTQADRYDLSQKVDYIDYGKRGDDLTVSVHAFNGSELYRNDNASEQELSDTIGKDLTKKIIEGAEAGVSKRLTGADLKLGGEGMKGFYDKMLPSAVNKYVKKFGAKVEVGGIDQHIPDHLSFDKWHMEEYGEEFNALTKDSEMLGKRYDEYSKKWEVDHKSQPIHKVEITDAMRESVQQGQVSYQVVQTDTAAFKSWFKDSKVVDADGKPLIVYHGGDMMGFDEFETEGKGKTEGTGAFFTNDFTMAKTYSSHKGTVSPKPSLEQVIKDPAAYDFEVSYNEEYEQWEAESPVGHHEGDTEEEAIEMAFDEWTGEAESGIYDVYLSMKDPMIVDAAGQNWDDISEGWDMLNEDGDAEDTVYTEEEADKLVADGKFDSHRRSYGRSTDDIIREAHDMGDGIDGVIIRNVSDSGASGFGGESGDIYVVFKPNQIKSATDNVGTFDPADPRITYQVTETSEFKSWFKDSKVLDENGNPQILMHGTASDWDTFEKGAAVGGMHPTKSLGFFATPLEETAAWYAANAEKRGWGAGNKARVLKLYAAITNPYDISREDFYELQMPQQISEFKKKLLDAGHDGIKVIDDDGTVIEYVAFKPEQFKSATDNRGTFDPNDARITYQVEATMDDFTKENVSDIANKTGWMIFTAENPNAVQVSDGENVTRNEELRTHLEAQGLEHRQVVGRYEGLENPFLIVGTDDSRRNAAALAREYDQQSVLTHEGLVYQDGSLHAATGKTEVFKSAPKDYYTTMPDGTMFGMELDFSTKIEPEPPIKETGESGELVDGEIDGDTLADLIDKPSFQIEEDGWKTLTAKDLRGKKLFGFYADRMSVGTYTGLDPASGINIKMQGGIDYPIHHKGAAWVVSSDSMHSSLANAADSRDGIAVVIAYASGNITGNPTFADAYIAELKWAIESGKISKTAALKILNKVRKESVSNYKTKQRNDQRKADEGGGAQGLIDKFRKAALSKNGKLTDNQNEALLEYYGSESKVNRLISELKKAEVTKFVKDFAADFSKKRLAPWAIQNKTNWKTVEEFFDSLTGRGATFDSRGAKMFKTGKNVEGNVTAQKLGANQYLKEGMPDIERMIHLMEVEGSQDINTGDILGLVQIDKGQAGQAASASDIGVDEHKSYSKILKGKPYGKLPKTVNILDIFNPRGGYLPLAGEVLKFKDEGRVGELDEVAFQIGLDPEADYQRDLDAIAQKLSKEEAKRLAQIRKLHDAGEDVTDKLEQLDNLRKSMPTAIRHRLGGDVQISRRKTEKGRQSELNRRTQKAVELEQSHEAMKRKSWLRRTLNRFGASRGAKLQGQSKEMTQKVRDTLKVAAYAANSDSWEDVVKRSTKPQSLTQVEFEQIAADFAGLLQPTNKNAAKIEAAYYAVQDLMREGKYTMNKIRADRLAMFEKATDEIKEGVLAGERANNDAEQKTADAKKGLDERLTAWVDSGMTGMTAGFENIVRRIDGEQGGALWEFLYADEVDGVNASVDRKNSYMMEQGEFITTGLAKAFPDLVDKNGDPDVTAIVRELAKLDARPAKATDTGIRFADNEKSEVQAQPVSKSEAMSIWLVLRQEGSRSTFRDQHAITDFEGFQRALEEYIGIDGMAVIDNVITPFYEDAFYDLNEVFKRVEGYDMDKVENYFRFMRESGFAGKDIEDAINPFAGFTEENSNSIDKGATMTRTENATSPFKFISALEVLTQSAGFNANYIGMAGLEKRLRYLHTNDEFKRAVRQKYGTSGVQQLRKAAESVIAGRIKVEGWGGRLLEGIRSVGITSVLALKPKIALTQLTSGIAGIVEMPAQEWVSWVSKIVENPTKHWNIIKGTPAMKDRMSRGQSQEVLMELNKIGRLSLQSGVLAKLETATRYSMALIKMGDIVGATVSAAPVYFHTYETVLAETGDVGTAKRKAEQAFSRSVNRSQQSPHLYARPQAYQNNAFMRVLYQFRSSPIQYLSETHMAVREYVASQRRLDWSPEKRARVAKQSLKAMFIYHIAMPQFFFAVNNAMIGLWLDDDERRIGYWQGMLWTLVFGNFGALPVYGDAIVATLAGLMDVDHFPVTVAPSGLQNVQHIEKHAKHLLKPESMDEFLDGAAHLLDFSGLGASTLKDGVQSTFDMIDEGDPTEMLEILGWSDHLFGDE